MTKPRNPNGKRNKKETSTLVAKGRKYEGRSIIDRVIKDAPARQPDPLGFFPSGRWLRFVVLNGRRSADSVCFRYVEDRTRYYDWAHPFETPDKKQRKK